MTDWLEEIAKRRKMVEEDEGNCDLVAWMVWHWEVTPERIRSIARTVEKGYPTANDVNWLLDLLENYIKEQQQ